MHQELHWLDIPERVSYKLGILTHRCLPVYLSNCCIPVSQVAIRRHLRSAAYVISWPFRDIVFALITVVGHSLSLVRWRSTLCQIICETPLSAQQLSDNCWKHSNHTFSLPISTFSALGVSHVMRYINLRYLLTYFSVLDTVGWVIWAVKIVPDMTYNVFGATLNPTPYYYFMLSCGVCLVVSLSVTRVYCVESSKQSSSSSN